MQTVRAHNGDELVDPAVAKSVWERNRYSVPGRMWKYHGSSRQVRKRTVWGGGRGERTVRGRLRQALKPLLPSSI